ncbi:MAG: hypothetical protein GY777_05775, partial [Candidatus Brocadiaceae bacterium]|nr:hypothetical protein [Candidatus Brocadiaceae bacterium]
MEYMDVAVGGQKPPYGRKQKIDYRDVLSDADFTMFSKLRELQKTIDESKDVPVNKKKTEAMHAVFVR